MASGVLVFNYAVLAGRRDANEDRPFECVAAAGAVPHAKTSRYAKQDAALRGSPFSRSGSPHGPAVPLVSRSFEMLKRTEERDAVCFHARQRHLATGIL